MLYVSVDVIVIDRVYMHFVSHIGSGSCLNRPDLFPGWRQV